MPFPTPHNNIKLNCSIILNLSISARNHSGKMRSKIKILLKKSWNNLYEMCLYFQTVVFGCVCMLKIRQKNMCQDFLMVMMQHDLKVSYDFSTLDVWAQTLIFIVTLSLSFHFWITFPTAQSENTHTVKQTMPLPDKWYRLLAFCTTSWPVGFQRTGHWTALPFD